MKRYARGMHPYHQYYQRRSLYINTNKRRWPWLVAVLPAVTLLVIGVFLYARPLPLLTPQKRVLALSTSPPQISWPRASQAAFGTTQQGLLESKPGQIIRPTASTIKLLTVLTVLDKKPLKPGEQGPLVPITQSDVNIYSNYYSRNGSSIPVAVGEKISQRQMLEGILIPSANNYADTLATWAFGSLEEYLNAARAMAQKLGMKQTTLGADASGFSPTTTSNAADLTRLGMATMEQPVITEIISKPEVELPLAGVKENTNWLLDQEGVIGIKTGNTNEAGGVFIFAADRKLDELHKVTIVGTVQGERTVYDAIVQARGLIKQVGPYFKVATPVKKGQTLATYTAPWGPKINAVAKNDISFAYWPGTDMKSSLALDNIASTIPSDKQVGTINVGGDSSQVVTSGQLTDPSWQWRLFGKR